MDNTTILGIGSRVKHPAFGDGVIIRLHPVAYDVCFMLYGIKQVGKDYEKWEIIDAIAAEEGVSYSEMEKSLIKVLRNFNALKEEVELGDKWQEGTLILQPKDDGLKAKEMSIESFFHKIVMVRDRLRVMEQRINSSKNLSDEEKVNLQQYLTRIYGSLTSFNVLFKYKEDQFVGERSKG
ncbi:MAG: hypothetical protein AAFO82_02600 [Bacteroidota bacterium]